MKPIYSIKDWDRDFENHESRKIVRARWLPVPNKHDGKTYRRIARHPRAVEIFCAWNLIIQVASKMPTRGILVDYDGPLGADDLADKTDYPEEIFEVALAVLVEPKYGWMEVLSNGVVLPAPGPPPGEKADLPGEPDISPGETGTENPLAGIEGNGREGKRKERPASGTQEYFDKLKLPFTSVDFMTEWIDYEQHRNQGRKKLTPIARQRLFRQFEVWGEAKTIASIKYSLLKGWTGIFEDPNFKESTQAPMFAPAPISPEEQALRDNCTRCNGTGMEVVPGKGARPCDHLPTEGIE